MHIGKIPLPDFPLLLAPMEDVSDPPFRLLCKEQGADLMFSEFISSEGLIRAAVKSKKKLDIFPEERPVGIQIFGGDEEAMGLCAAIVAATEPDLIDINFGCPVKKVVCKGAGAAVLKDPKLMIRLTREVIKKTQLPVTVKTRLGWDEQHIHIEYICEALQDIGVQAISIHARTRTQMYKGAADWSWIARVKNNPRIKIPIFGNGDIDSPEKAKIYKDRYVPDGLMIGRAAIGNPWIFKQIKHYLQTGETLAPPAVQERIQLCRQHLLRALAWKGSPKGLLEMRRHYGAYFKGLPHIKEWRNRLVQAPAPEEVYAILDEIPPEYA